MKVVRARALRVNCPKCGVGAGVACKRSDGTSRKSVHMARISQAGQRANVPSFFKEKKDSFYTSDEWRRLRYKALVRHGGRCQCCGATPGPGTSLHVDHIVPRSKNRALELEIENLQVLCEACNLGKGASDTTDWRRAV